MPRLTLLVLIVLAGCTRGPCDRSYEEVTEGDLRGTEAYGLSLRLGWDKKRSLFTLSFANHGEHGMILDLGGACNGQVWLQHVTILEQRRMEPHRWWLHQRPMSLAAFALVEDHIVLLPAGANLEFALDWQPAWPFEVLDHAAAFHARNPVQIHAVYGAGIWYYPDPSNSVDFIARTWTSNALALHIVDQAAYDEQKLAEGDPVGWDAMRAAIRKGPGWERLEIPAPALPQSPE